MSDTNIQFNPSKNEKPARNEVKLIKLSTKKVQENAMYSLFHTRHLQYWLDGDLFYECKKFSGLKDKGIWFHLVEGNGTPRDNSNFYGKFGFKIEKQPIFENIDIYYFTTTMHKNEVSSYYFGITKGTDLPFSEIKYENEIVELTEYNKNVLFDHGTLESNPQNFLPTTKSYNEYTWFSHNLFLFEGSYSWEAKFLSCKHSDICLDTRIVNGPQCIERCVDKNESNLRNNRHFDGVKYNWIVEDIIRIPFLSKFMTEGYFELEDGYLQKFLKICIDKEKLEFNEEKIEHIVLPKVKNSFMKLSLYYVKHLQDFTSEDSPDKYSFGDCNHGIRGKFGFVLDVGDKIDFYYKDTKIIGNIIYNNYVGVKKGSYTPNSAILKKNTFAPIVAESFQHINLLKVDISIIKTCGAKFIEFEHKSCEELNCIEKAADTESMTYAQFDSKYLEYQEDFLNKVGQYLFIKNESLQMKEMGGVKFKQKIIEQLVQDYCNVHFTVKKNKK